MAEAGHEFPVSLAYKVAVDGLTVTVTDGPVSVIVAEPEAVGSDCEVAVTVTVDEAGMIPGAVYCAVEVPVVTIDPLTGLIDQVTDELLALTTVAEKFCCAPSTTWDAGGDYGDNSAFAGAAESAAGHERCQPTQRE